MKTENIRFRIPLQFFAEGAASGTDGAGAGGEGAGGFEAGTEGVGDDDIFLAEMEQKYGVTSGVASAQARELVSRRGSDARSEEAENGGDDTDENANAEEEGKSAEEEYEELIKSDKFKHIHGAKIKATIDARFKNQTDARAEADKYKGALSLLATKYGKSAEDVEGIIAALEADDELLEGEALEKGKTVEALREDKKRDKTLKETQKELSDMREQLRETQKREELRENFARWTAEARETKKQYADFDFETELKNAEFRKFLTGGMSVTEAYKHAHLDDIIGGSIKAARESAYSDASHVVAKNLGRPSEGAASSRRSEAPAKISVRNMSDADFDSIEERMARGEKVTLDHIRR